MGFFETLFYYIGIICIFRGLFYFYRWIISYICPPVDLKSKYKSEWALVTGANSGLGNQIALKLAEQGYNIIGTGRNVQSLEDAKNKIEQKNVKFMTVIADFSTSQGVNTVIDVINNNDVKILILNAGYGVFDAVESTDDEVIYKFISTMCTSYAQLSKCFISKHKDSKEKSLLFITSSLAAETYAPLASLYSSVKAYKSALGKHLYLEESASNIDITILQPGFFSKSSFFGNLPPFLAKIFTRDRIFPTSEEVADCASRTFGRTSIVDCSFSSLLLRLMCWLSGEIMTDKTSEYIAYVANKANEKVKQD